MLRFGVLFALVAAATAASPNETLRTQWEAFKARYNKTYRSNNEERLRFSIFTKNNLVIAEHNKRHAKGLVSYKMGVNQFGDMVSHEFVKMMSDFPGKRFGDNASVYQPPDNLKGSSLPETVDWRDSGAVTPVMDQGECRSGYAFSSAGAVEAQHFLRNNKRGPTSLSPQNIVDCSKQYGNYGCNGGYMTTTFKYIVENGGINSEIDYPYVGEEQDCHFTKEDIAAAVTGFVAIKQDSEEDLKEALAREGPIAVAICVTPPGVQFYSTGVYREPACTPDSLNLSALVVGYGVQNDDNYWLIKNSWGESWGDKGYIRMSRDEQNQCGIASAASFPVV